MAIRDEIVYLKFHSLLRRLLLVLVSFVISSCFLTNAIADTGIALFDSWAGTVNFTGMQKTLRTNSNDVNACSVTTGVTSATLSGLPSTGTNTVLAAYLYWAGSGATPDYTVTFESNSITASRQYTSTNSGEAYFSGVADVTSVVAAKGNGSYSFSGLTVDTSSTYCSTQAVLAGWALLVIYSNPTADSTNRVLNLYEGFSSFQNSSITINLSNFKIPTPLGATSGKAGHLTWEGDGTISSTSENLTFNGYTLSDTNNPVNNQFNSVSTISPTVDFASYGVDFDVYSIASPTIVAGQTTATTVYSSGQDLVFLSAEIFAVPNVPVADLAITMGYSGTMQRGTTVNYTLNVSNAGPSAETGPITVTDTLPTGLTYVSASGAGWSCGASGQVVTCTRTGSLAKGASANAIAVTATVANTATGTLTNSATVAGALFDNDSGNNTATNSQDVAAADLSISIIRSSTLTAGSNASYTLVVGNNGPLNETGTITVSDVLPSGLTLVSAVGSGWTCGTGVTCTYSAGLASGATAPAVVLTVAVASGTTGTITNSATVAGTQYDDNSANNTATDSYTILPTAYAYYKLDGDFSDSSGNGRTATAQGNGVAATTLAPASGLKGDTCKAVMIPTNTSVSTVQGVNTGIGVNSLGNAGTIAFWYNGNQAWNAAGGNVDDRTLIDGSGTGILAIDRFYVVLTQSGTLQFVIRDANGSVRTVTTAAQTTGAGTWAHIAVVWNFSSSTSGYMLIYVNGALAATSGAVTLPVRSSYGTLFLGDTLNSNAVINSNRGNSADGVMDEVAIYSGALTATQITQLMDNAHSCPATLAHYAISHSGTGLTCEAEPVTVTAHDSYHASTDAGGRTVTVTARNVSSGAAIGSWVASADSCSRICYNAAGTAQTCVNSFSNTTGNNGVATYTFASGETGIRLCLKQSSAITENVNVIDSSGAVESATEDANLVFSTTGFRFYANGVVDALASLTAGLRSDVADSTYQPSPQTLTIRAVKTSETTPARCVSLLGSTTRTIQFAYQCVDPSSCNAASAGFEVNGTAVAGSGSAPTPASSVAVAFDASGYGSINLKSWDVGSFKVYASGSIADATTGTSVSIVSGNSNTFLVRPYGFSVIACTGSTPCSSANASATDGSGSVFTSAGTAFNATVRAVAYGGSVVTPSFGLGTANGTEVVTLARTLVAPSSGATGALGGTTTLYRSAFTNGVANLSDLTWSEVGVISLSAMNGAFEGVSLSPAATGVSGAIGRFTPHHFGVSGSVVNRSDLASPGGSFTYMDEPMKMTLTVTAYSASDSVTTNYAGSFAKLDAATLGTGSSWFNTGCSATSQCFGLGALGGTTGLSGRLAVKTASDFSNISSPSSSWTAGVGTFIAHVALARASAPDGSYEALSVGAMPRDADGISLPGPTSSDVHKVDLDATTGSTLASNPDGTAERKLVFMTKSRFGRLRLISGQGSELAPYVMKTEAQYWDGSYWRTNVDDSGSLYVVGNAALTGATGTSAVGAGAVAGGYGTLTLAKPTASGMATVCLDLATSSDGCSGSSAAGLAYLRGNWGSSSYDRDPSATVLFGGGGANSRGNWGFLYRRENF
ncbi:conserved repeat domain-containing protein [Propionivibrio dicarboxylicus]|uniref:Conserved repeat domain-containing protein n=1 Tax=Propionivibrio dicarboxylicus TaxID=83767 RepID=A0A1G8IJ01_9RHOO|nr:conserved repeat domain-containing protein [Propionivibrio dicarboxylicus]